MSAPVSPVLNHDIPPMMMENNNANQQQQQQPSSFSIPFGLSQQQQQQQQPSSSQEMNGNFRPFFSNFSNSQGNNNMGGGGGGGGGFAATTNSVFGMQPQQGRVWGIPTNQRQQQQYQQQQQQQQQQQRDVLDRVDQLGDEYMELSHKSIILTQESKDLKKQKEERFDMLTNELDRNDIREMILSDKSKIEYLTDRPPKEKNPSITQFLRYLIETGIVLVNDETFTEDDLNMWVNTKINQCKQAEEKGNSWVHRAPSLDTVKRYSKEGKKKSKHKRQNFRNQQQQQQQPMVVQPGGGFYAPPNGGVQ